MHARVCEDLPRPVMHLARGEDRRTKHRNGHDDGLQNHNPDEPPDHRTRRILLAPGREEFLIHALIAQHQQARWQEQLSGLDVAYVAK